MDVFCFLCGNPSHGSIYTKTNFLEDLEFYEKTKNSKQKKYKWFLDYFIQVNKLYEKDPKNFLEKISNLTKNTKWLNKCTFLSANNKIIHGCKNTSWNVEFTDKNYNTHMHSTFYYDGDDYGVFVHTDCWKFIKQQYGISLTYSNLPIRCDPYSYKIFDFVNYGQIEKYWGQDINIIKIIGDSNDELCNSPLKSKLVANNIKKVFSKLKIKNDPSRKGPIVSATFYKSGTYRVGNNGNIWTIKTGKWNELKDTMKLSLNSDPQNIVYIADKNTVPIFILKEKTKKNKCEILTTQDYAIQHKLIK